MQINFIFFVLKKRITGYKLWPSQKVAIRKQNGKSTTNEQCVCSQ